MAIDLEKVCTIQVDLASEAHEVGSGPYGRRRVLEIVGGTVTGERLSGVVLPGGADCLLLDPDGWGRLDVRMQWRMDDGPMIFVSAQGLCEFNELVLEAGEAGEPTDFDDQYYRTLMRMESGDDRFGWVNRAVFVTEGRISPGSSGRGIAAGVFAVI